MNRLAAAGVAVSLMAGPAGWLCAAAHPPGSAAETAGEILQESQRHQRAESEEYLGEVTVISRTGKERHKEWRSYRQGSSGSAKRFIRFLSPPDVRGVGYLALEHPGKETDAWLYLPSMKRERRIGRRDRESAFVGTNFNYEDLDLLELDDARYEASLLPERTIDGVAVYVVELVPRVPSVYAKKILTIRKDNLCLQTAESYVGGDASPVKRLTFANYTSVEGYLIAERLEMVDVRKGGRTIVTLHDVAVDQPQPSDRYTIQNLLREDEDSPSTGGRPRASASVSSPSWNLQAPESSLRATSLTGGFSGYVETQSLAYPRGGTAHDSALWQWGTAFVRQTARAGPVRATAAVRFEGSSGGQDGGILFDPADRDARRSPISVRELSVVVPLRPTVDFEAGRFETTWGETDSYSPVDAFLPRDLSGPQPEEALPLWAARLRGQSRGVRFELLVAPTTTPWRLPSLEGRQSPLSSIGVFFASQPTSVPRTGFEFVRLAGTVAGWDLGGWVRTGIRPAAVLVPETNEATQTADGLVVPLAQHFAHENAAGAQLSREYGGWAVHGELGLFHSNDPSLGDAAIWAVGGSRAAGDGTFTATVAANAIEPPVNPLLLLDRALLPAAILAFRGLEPWGGWRVAWLGTFHTVGGILSGELTKDLTDNFKVTVGVDAPEGAPASPARAFLGGTRVRAAFRANW